MNKVVIFYGPLKGFYDYLDKENINRSELTTFSYLVRKYDEESREYKLNVPNGEPKTKEKEEVQYLIIYSDEYASVREHVIVNLDGFIANFIVENLFIHNPPEIISKKITKFYPGTEIINYKYRNLSKRNILKFNREFGKSIVGQESVKRKFLVSLYPLLRKSFNKPTVILFYGPSGVGKTESAKYLSSILGGDLLRKQLSMFQNDDFVTYLFGGQHYEKSFAKDLLDRETNVILLDEFDKANKLFHSAFYQLFDEGIFVDKNYEVKIGKAIIICTSNYTSLDEIKTQLGDPIFSRFDNCIRFNELTEDSIRNIIRLRLDQEYKNLTPNEAVLINENEIMSCFNNHISKIKNARNIESLVRDVISSKLLDSLLEDSVVQENNYD